MKRIYDFSRKPAKRNYTISDLQALKQKPKKLTMSNPANADTGHLLHECGTALWATHVFL